MNKNVGGFENCASGAGSIPDEGLRFDQQIEKTGFCRKLLLSNSSQKRIGSTYQEYIFLKLLAIVNLVFPKILNFPQKRGKPMRDNG